VSKSCPRCRTALVAPFLSCEMCPWSSMKPADTPRRGFIHMDPQEKAEYERQGKRSGDLTEQQWYNVCRFWPTVARRCRRPFADVGQHNPLHGTSRIGPLMKSVYVDEERIAIQAEAA
jgi:hypothetical protein